MTRYLRSGSAWIVGGGLHGQWVPNHRGLFIQNRSAALGNAVSGGTSLAKRFRWANDSAHVQEQHCERGLQVSAAGSTPEDRIDLVLQAAREQQFGDELLNDVRDALLGKKNASLGRPDPTNATPLRTAVITIQWSGRLGNLLFELAMLAGMVKRLKATVANVEAVTFGLPDVEGVPVKELFEQFSLGELVRQADDEKGSFDGAYAARAQSVLGVQDPSGGEVCQRVRCEAGQPADQVGDVATARLHARPDRAQGLLPELPLFR